MSPEARDVTAVVINYNTAALSLRCTRSLAEAGVPRIVLLDNASREDDYATLVRDQAAIPQVRLVRSEANLGFAAGSNRGIQLALADDTCGRVLLLNSDAVVDAQGLEACLRAMREGRHALMGGRMVKPGSDVVDSLGIALYKCLLASNRKSTDEAYLGPTGGFAIYTRAFLEEVTRLHGYVFDPSYFCYAEDTDLCVRARLLGASAGYVDDVVAHHAGQASTEGDYNDFILYHGIRNSIWMVAKSMPGWLIVRQLFWVILLHGGIVVRHVLQGRARTVFRLYRDAAAALPHVLRERRMMQRTRRVTLAEFRRHIDRRFYETQFLGGAIRDLFRPGRRATPRS